MVAKGAIANYILTHTSVDGGHAVEAAVNSGAFLEATSRMGLSKPLGRWQRSRARNHYSIGLYAEPLEERTLLALVAAYGFNDGSGTTLTDSAGNALHGTISGAAWTTSGRFGGALTFDGVNDLVTVADAIALDLTTGMTLEAWVYPTANGGGSWRNVVIKERPNGEVYNLYANADTNAPTVYVVRSSAPNAPIDARGTSQLPLNTWTHLAATYDGANLRIYADGVQVGTRAVTGSLLTSTGALRIGGNSIWGEYFAGRIDDVRIYNTALTQTQIQADMNTAVGDTNPPVRSNGQPTGTLPFGTTQTTLSLTTDESATCRYSTTAGVSYSAMANTFATTGGTSHSTTVSGLATGNYTFYVRCADAALNANTDDFVIAFNVAAAPGDTAPPTVAITAPLDESAVAGAIVVSADANDDVGVVGVQFFLDGAALGAEDLSAPYSLAWDTTIVAGGPHVLTARARDAAGNNTLSSPISVDVANNSVPPSFLDEVVVGVGMSFPTAFEFLPDGRMLIAEFGGNVLILQPGASLVDATPVLQLTNIFNEDVTAGGERGLVNVLADPNFATNGYIYLFYTAASPQRDRVSRFTMVGNSASLATETVIWQGVADSTSDSHHGGGLAFGPDNKLYISTGDNGDPPSSQPLTSDHGKILRVNPDGTIPSDNPFVDGAEPNIDAIWAHGLRNPYRSSFDSANGRMYIGDVGFNTTEEVNIGVAGANYGWPTCEGPCGTAGMTNPLYSYSHGGRDAAITGGFVYRGTQFPAPYQGSYFYGDFAQNWIRYLTLDGAGDVTGSHNFLPANGSLDGPHDPVMLKPGPDGSLYYVDFGWGWQGGVNTAAIRRIRYVAANQPPVAIASGTPLNGPAPLTVNFSSAGSVDPEGQPLTYSWTFGDGGTSTLASPVHQYAQAGVYTAQLSVSDGNSTAASDVLFISVGTLPDGTITSPANGLTFRAGDVVNFTGTATDAEDGTLPASAYSWTVLFHHDTHAHPTLGPLTGQTSGSLTIPTSGHDFSGQTSYEIILTVTDSTGLQDTTSVFVYPEKVNLNLDTSPTGLNVLVDGIPRTAPFVIDSLIGFQHTFDAPAQQTVGSTSYDFASWSDAGARVHTITTPAAPTSYTATYTLTPATLIGSEGYGYSAYTHPFESIDLVPGAAGVSTVITSGNNSAATITLTSGNSFRYYGTSYTSFSVSTNGLITFGGSNTSATNTDLTTAPTQSAMAPLWDDWIHTSGNAIVLSKYEDTNEDGVLDRLIIEWNNAQGNPTSPSPVTFQAILQLNTGTVPGQFTFNYPDLDSGNSQSNGGSATIGIKDSGTQGARRLLVSFNNASSPYVGSGKAIRFLPETIGPTVALTSPSSGAVVTGTVSVTASAADNVSVAGVQFLLNGANLGTEDIASPYSVNWNTAGLASGSYTLTARARDAVGNQTTSSAVIVTVDNTAPTVSVTSPANGSTLTGTVSVTANAADNVSVAGVQFLLNGASLGAEDTLSPFSINWDTTGLAPGSYTLSARARDSVGNLTTSAGVGVNVPNAADTTPPKVLSVTPNMGATNVATSIALTVQFDEPMNAATVNATTIELRDSAGTQTPVTVNYDAPTNTATVVPSGALAIQNDYYTARVVGGATGAKDAAGNALSADFSWSFSTGAPVFQESIAFSGLVQPTAVRFATDGRVFVAEKSGLIKVFDSLSDSTPDVFTDLRTNVHNFWDRGLLDLALPPDFPTNPYVYVLYTYDGDIGGPAPKYGTPGQTSDPGPNATTTGALVSGRLSRLRAAGNFMTGNEEVLIHDWAQQFPSHSIGSIVFGADGALYASAGDGASFNYVDSGQTGNPFNDPVSEGGALRSQDLLSPFDPTTLDGSIIRIDPDTGLALPIGSTMTVLGAPGVDANGVEYYSVLSAYQGSQSTTLRILRPTNPSPGEPQRFLYLFPVTFGLTDLNSEFGDGLEQARVLNLHNLHNATLVAPSFNIEPWYGDHATDTTRWQESFIVKDVVPFVDQFAAPGTVPERWAVGFSKSATGVLQLIFRNPNVFSAAAAWDGPAQFTDMSAFPGMAENFGTEANFDNYEIPTLVATRNGPFQSRNRIWISGDNSAWTSHMQTLTTQMTAAGVLHTYVGGVNRQHHWNSGWLEIAVASLDVNSNSTPRHDENARRIIAEGLRNPFRVTVRPGTNELWAGDVGWNTWEEINRLDNPADGAIDNFGWPAYEGNNRQSGYDSANLPLLEALYAAGSSAHDAPYFAYNHSAQVDPSSPSEPTGGSSIAGLAFAQGGNMPAAFDGALFFADYSRNTIWTMYRGVDGLPDPTNIKAISRPAQGPVNLLIGPDGSLYYADFNGGTIRRLFFVPGNQPPIAIAQATPLTGSAPLLVQFDGTASSDPDAGTTLSYSWDLDGDGQFGDSTSAQPSFNYVAAGAYVVGLRVTDNGGLSGTDTLIINVDNTPPTALIDGPAGSTTWRVGDVIAFSGHADDEQQGTLPASALTWSLIMHHCSALVPTDCHTHTVQDFVGVSSGNFTAPDHAYPAYLELRLTATDAGGLQHSASVELQPQTVQLTVQSTPAGLVASLNSESAATPFSRTVIVGSSNSLSAPSPQSLGGTNYSFVSWSDGGAQTHNIVAPSAPTSYTTTFAVAPSGLVAAYGFNDGSGTTLTDVSGNALHGTISGAAWTTSGRFGGALTFDGVNDLVTVADANALDLTTGMTLEAWVYPTANGGGSWRNLVIKERPNGEVYNLYANADTNAPTVYVVRSSAPNAPIDARGTSQLPLNTWTHLAATYDGANLRIYADGVQVGTRAVTGSLLTSTGALRIGGNSIWGEYFAGRIDDLRIYNRALSQAEIQTDMNLGVGGGGGLALETNRAASIETPTVLATGILEPLRIEAVQRWEANGASAAELEMLRSLAIEFVDLPPMQLGLTTPGMLWLDRDASGQGWFIDSTPGDDDEFAIGRIDGSVLDRVDLLSVLVHEMGHALGLEHTDADDVMHESLAAGVRRMPGATWNPVAVHANGERAAALAVDEHGRGASRAALSVVDAALTEFLGPVLPVRMPSQRRSQLPNDVASLARRSTMRSTMPPPAERPMPALLDRLNRFDQRTAQSRLDAAAMVDLAREIALSDVAEQLPNSQARSIGTRRKV